MVFQRPTPSQPDIYDNVIAGYKLNGIGCQRPSGTGCRAFPHACGGLWNEVKDFPGPKRAPSSSLRWSAATVVYRPRRRHGPEVLLFDEPTSALDPISTSTVEELFHELKTNYTLIILPTTCSNRPVSDKDRFFLSG